MRKNILLRSTYLIMLLYEIVLMILSFFINVNSWLVVLLGIITAAVFFISGTNDFRKDRSLLGLGKEILGALLLTCGVSVYITILYIQNLSNTHPTPTFDFLYVGNIYDAIILFSCSLATLICAD